MLMREHSSDEDGGYFLVLEIENLQRYTFTQMRFSRSRAF
jgi:hypothetical protein